MLEFQETSFVDTPGFPNHPWPAVPSTSFTALTVRQQSLICYDNQDVYSPSFMPLTYSYTLPHGDIGNGPYDYDLGYSNFLEESDYESFDLGRVYDAPLEQNDTLGHNYFDHGHLVQPQLVNLDLATAKAKQLPRHQDFTNAHTVWRSFRIFIVAISTSLPSIDKRDLSVKILHASEAVFQAAVSSSATSEPQNLTLQRIRRRTGAAAEKRPHARITICAICAQGWDAQNPALFSLDAFVESRISVERTTLSTHRSAA